MSEANESINRKESSTAQISANFSTREKMVIVRYLLQKKLDTSEIHKLLSAVCRETAPSYKDVRDWIKEIKILETRERLGKSSRKLSAFTDTDPVLVGKLENLLYMDQRISVEQMSEMTTVSTHTVQHYVDKVLGLKRVAERWVPRLWTPDQRAYRVAVSKELWDLFQNDSSMLSSVIVGDESFVLYYSPNAGHTNDVESTDTPQSEQLVTNYESAAEWKRLHCVFFFDMEGMLVAEYLPSDEPCTKDQYADILQRSLKSAIRDRGGNFKPSYLLHSMTPVHCSIPTKEALNTMGIMALPNVPASPDIEPYDYWFFKNLKKRLNGKTFSTKEELWHAVQHYIASIPKQEFHDSVLRLISRWNSCVESQGLYFL